ncbi:MATE efflux family protein [Actinidia rufa]|uniref:Protein DETOXIFICATION n=1 Tax=Actinidia rufa TaxID=165716 RepID=A0A7J0GHG7_9ERIC|nr:MATE efflux family protein [Actinidia rufa]
MGSVKRYDEELNQALVASGSNDDDSLELKTRVLMESKKLWNIVGPSIFSRVATYSMNVITQAFAGHLGDLELASLSIANTVIVGLNFGLLKPYAGKHSGPKGTTCWAFTCKDRGLFSSSPAFLLLPLYVFTTPLLKLLGQPDDVAEQSGLVAAWLIPLHFSFAFQFPLQRFLQCQLKAGVVAWVSLAVLVIHVFMSWIFMYLFQFGVVGAAITLDVSWWLLCFGMFGYTWCGGCPEAWTGFSSKAFSRLWEFVKLSVASGVMLCLENWYYRILILMTGYLKNSTIAVDALSVCMSINGWEMMIPLAFFAATGVRVANELGAGNGKGAKFATVVSVVQSTLIGLFFCVLIMIFHDEFALMFTSSSDVLEAVNNLSFLLAVTILLNSVQPVLSGVAVGSGWQSKVAYINLGCYYLVGLPLGIVLGWGIWGGMIFGGTFVQTIILANITMQCNWEKEAEKATMHVQNWSSPTSDHNES